MRSVFYTILIFIAMAGGTVGDLAAQYAMSDKCILTYKGQTRNRTISASGVIRAECGGDLHSAPYGNWGVTSNYGRVKDSNQFPGHHRGRAWRTRERIWQWNSCTTRYPEPNGQRSIIGIATHGRKLHRISVPCAGPNIFIPIPSVEGCNAAPSTWSVHGNFMSLYELDWDGNDFVTTLYFPSTSSATNCSYYQCTGETSTSAGWVGVSRSTRPTTGVDAQARVKVSARYQPGCVW